MSFYTDAAPHTMEIHAQRAEIIFPYIGKRFKDSGKTCLDIGCHEGWFSEYCAGIGMETLGIDVNPSHIAEAAKGKATYAVKDWSEIQDQYDLVLCLGLLYHLDDPIGLCRKLRQVTREVCIVESAIIEGLEPMLELQTASPEFSLCNIVFRPSLSALQRMLTSEGFLISGVEHYRHERAIIFCE